MIGHILMVAALEIHLRGLTSVLCIRDQRGKAAIPQVGTAQTGRRGLPDDRNVEPEHHELTGQLPTATWTLVLEVKLGLTGQQELPHRPPQRSDGGGLDGHAAHQVATSPLALVDEDEPAGHDSARLKSWPATLVAASASMPSTTWL